MYLFISKNVSPVIVLSYVIAALTIHTRSGLKVHFVKRNHRIVFALSLRTESPPFIEDAIIFFHASGALPVKDQPSTESAISERSTLSRIVIDVR